MHLGKPGLASLIYLFYSPQCHQLPQRSYFLFGDRLMVRCVTFWPSIQR